MKIRDNQNTKKGFTMVELLTTIVILGILSIVSIVAVNKILENSKKEYYKSLEKTIRLAGESYVQNNKTYLPKYIGGKNVVSLEKLQEQNYIKEVKDYNKEACYGNKTYVQVFKYAKDKYSYISYLNCPNYTSKETIHDISPEITITYDNNKPIADITIKGNPSDSSEKDVKLLSYHYIIYRDNKEVINTGDIEANYKKQIKIEDLNLSKYTPGTVNIKVTATNIYGQTTVQEEDNYYEDKTLPNCVIKSEDDENSPKSWTNTDRKITIGCADGDGSGCEKDTYTKTFYTTTKIGTITIRDKAGNKKKCNVSVYVDKTAPTCTVNATPDGLNNWFITNANLTLSYSDSDSGINSYDLTTNSTASYNSKASGTQEEETKSTTWYGYVKDKAGNVGNCKKTIKLDKTPPTVKITAYKKGTSTVIKATKTNPATFDIGSTNDKIRIELDKSDAYSGVGEVTLNNLEGLNSNGDVYLSTEKKHNGTISISDKAGNVRTIKTTATINSSPQLTKGDCNIRGNYKWDTWDNNGWWCEGEGDRHWNLKYYQHYCYVGDGKIKKAPAPDFQYICPEAPYPDWTIIDDENREKTWTDNGDGTWTGWKIV